MTDTTIDRARALLILRESVRCADAVSMCNRMGDVLQELLAEVERLTLAASVHRDGRLNALERATAAEARLRELASAEPVAVIAEEYGQRYINWDDHSLPQIVKAHPVGTAFILRPEMPS